MRTHPRRHVGLSVLLVIPLFFVLPGAAQETVPESEHGPRTGSVQPVPPLPLYVDPSRADRHRPAFLQELLKAGKNKRAVYERYLPLIGANGIVDGLHQVWPTCHSEGHDLGKVIFAETQELGQSLRICGDGCHSGCMHGILMEAFSKTGRMKNGRLDLEALSPLLRSLCVEDPELRARYSPGDCAHGAGHALMVLNEYNIPLSLEGCGRMGSPAMEYYCATGSYMEYVEERDAEDSRTKSWLYPCDRHAFPAACARYKMVHVARRHYAARRSLDALRASCEKLEKVFRLGCYHGLGNAHTTLIAPGRVSLQAVCLNLDPAEEFMCIEGAMERMAKFDEPRAKQVCEPLTGRPRETCLTAVAHKMYALDKDLSLYMTH